MSLCEMCEMLDSDWSKLLILLLYTPSTDKPSLTYQLLKAVLHPKMDLFFISWLSQQTSVLVRTQSIWQSMMVLMGNAVSIPDKLNRLHLKETTRKHENLFILKLIYFKSPSKTIRIIVCILRNMVMMKWIMPASLTQTVSTCEKGFMCSSLLLSW